VDFIVYGPHGLWAIEVKNNSRINSRDTKSLIEFKHDYPIANTCLLYRGKDRIMENGVLCIPCEEFLKALKPNQPIVF
jgi:hypothetical protein